MITQDLNGIAHWKYHPFLVWLISLRFKIRSEIWLLLAEKPVDGHLISSSEPDWWGRPLHSRYCTLLGYIWRIPLNSVINSFKRDSLCEPFPCSHCVYSGINSFMHIYPQNYRYLLVILFLELIECVFFPRSLPWWSLWTVLCVNLTQHDLHYEKSSS